MDDLSRLQKQVTQNCGDLKQHRTQLSQLYAKVKKLEGGDVRPMEDIGPDLQARLEFLTGQVAKVQGEHVTLTQQLSQKDQLLERHSSLLQDLKQRVSASEGWQRGTSNDSAVESQMKQELQKHSVALEEAKFKRQDLQREMQQMHREMQQMQQVAEQLKQDPKLFGLQYELRESKASVADLERRLLDSGALTRKPPGPEKSQEQIEQSPPIGSLSLGEDMFSARLLLKLGYIKVDLKHRLPDTFDDNFDSTDSECSELNWTNIVSGISDPSVPKGVPSYKVLTRSTFFLCLMVMFIEFLAISEVVAFGFRNGEVCVEDSVTAFSRFDLHLSKMLGVIVVGFLMGKRMMDNLSYTMIGMLLHCSDTEHKIFAFLNFVSLVLGGFANGVLFAISTTPDGVWLKTTAMSVLINLRGAAALVAKSGIMGPTLSRSMNKVSYKISFYAEYPDWFSTFRNFTIVITCSFIIFFATTLFLVPLPTCPADGSKPRNIFTDMPGILRAAFEKGSW